MSGDDDWFERAKREIEEERAEGRSDEGEESDAQAGEGEELDVQAGEGEESDAQAGNGEESDAQAGKGDESDARPGQANDAGVREATSDDERSAGAGGDDPFGGGEFTREQSTDGDDPFGGGEFTREQSTDGDDPFGGGEFTREQSTDGDDPFGGDGPPRDGPPDPTGDRPEAESDDPFGGGGSGGGDDPFGGDEFGFGGSAAGDDEGESFDEEEYLSDIDRVNVGIEGLDEMILGGVPRRSLMVAIGSAGTGKTTFGLQFLEETLSAGNDAVYVTLEESEESILSSAEAKGWPFRRYAEEDRLAVVAIDPIEMANSLANISGDIGRLIEEFGADRLVLDSVSLLEMMYDDPATRRGEVFDFARSLKRAGVTTMLTSEADADNPFTSRYGIVEYLVDAVFVLRYVRPSDFRETRLAVEIQKIRDASHSRETKPYDITSDGISVYRQANIF